MDSALLQRMWLAKYFLTNTSSTAFQLALLLQVMSKFLWIAAERFQAGAD
jgi:hypothetical protein